MFKHWNRLPRQLVEPPSLEMLKTELDTVLWQPVLADPALSSGVGLDDVQRCLPISAILCDSMILYREELGNMSFFLIYKTSPDTYG